MKRCTQLLVAMHAIAILPSITITGAFSHVSRSRARVLKAHDKSTPEEVTFTDMDRSFGINGDLVTAESTQSQLFSAFAALELPDQYDAVLTGLCANIIDSNEIKSEQAMSYMRDPLQLLDEMNRKRIKASPRSLMAMIDVSRSDHSMQYFDYDNVPYKTLFHSNFCTI
jgi:hypothetical protein